MSVATVTRRLRTQMRERQHRNALLLVANTALGAGAGVAFWLVLTRALGVAPAAIGTGYAIVALGTLVAVLAKGGLDTAVLRLAPGANDRSARRILWTATAAAAGLAIALTAAAAGVLGGAGILPGLGAPGWLLTGAIAVGLCAMWLQDAYFLGVAGAGATLVRNAVASGLRVALPFLTVLLAWQEPVALAWAISVAAAVALGWAIQARAAPRSGRDVRPREVIRSGARNLAGSAAEFLPGLVLAPLVLATQGADAAAYFGIAWTMASMLYLVSAALGRSALAQMVHDEKGRARAVRRAAVQHAALVLPATLALALLAPLALAVFGPAYAANATGTLAVLALATFAVAPAYLYLALLRAEDHPAPLVAFPLLMLAALALLAPPLAASQGIQGVAWAWLAANVPFGAWATWRLIQVTKEVEEHGCATVGRPADLE